MIGLNGLKMSTPRLVLAGSALALVLAGCTQSDSFTINSGGDGELPEELRSPEQGLELLPWIDFQEVPMGMDDHIAIDEVGQQIVLTGPAAAQGESLEMGDVFFGDAHGGFAVQVVEVSQGADGVVVEYRPLALTNLVHGDWEMALDLRNVGYVDNDIATMHQELISEEWSFSFGEQGDLLVASGSAAIELSPELQFDGKAQLRAFGNDFINEEWGSGSCANALLDHDRWGTKAQVCADFLHLSLGLHANAEAHARLEAEFTRGTDHERVLLDRQYEDIHLVGPLSLTAGVTVTARANANGHGEGYLDYQADADLYAPLGFEWHHETGFRGLTPIADGERNFNFESDAYAHVDLNASFTLEAEVHFSLTVAGNNYVGFGGMGAGADLTAEAQYLPFGETPCMTAGVTFDSYFTGNVTAFVDASRIFLGTHEWDLVDINHRFPTVDLFSWNDSGQFCVDGDQRYVGELNNIYSQDCTSASNPFFGACTDTLMQHCFNPPQGSCEGYVDPDRNVLMVWPSGERVEMVRETAGSITLDVSHYFGVENDLCGTSDLYVKTNEPGATCESEEYFVLQQDQAPLDPHLDEEEKQELYDSGWLLEAGAEASACIENSGGSYQMDMACPRAGDDTTITVGSAGAQACIVGIGTCTFQAVDTMPMPSLQGLW